MTDWTACACESCVRACKTCPGWLHPDDLEPMAKHFDVSIEELFRTRLVVNWFEADEPVFVLSPAKTNDDAGEEASADPRGRCGLLTDDERCSAHGAHPLACRADLHDAFDIRDEIIDAWRPKQDQIVKLLGREPVTASFGWLDMMAGGF